MLRRLLDVCERSAGLSYPLKLAIDGGVGSFLPAMPDDEEQASKLGSSRHMHPVFAPLLLDAGDSSSSK